MLPAVPVPGLVTKFAWSGDGVEAPQPLTGGRVVRIDEAANAKFSSGDPHDDLVFDRQGRSSNGIALEGVGHLGFPKHTSGAGIQRDQRSVERAKEHAATQYSRPAIEGVYLVRTYYLLPSLKFPNLKSCPGVDGEHLSRRSGGIHSAVYYQRRRLQYGTPRHLYRPSRLQLADICRGDLMQGSEVLPLVIAPISQPVLRLLLSIAQSFKAQARGKLHLNGLAQITGFQALQVSDQVLNLGLGENLTVISRHQRFVFDLFRNQIALIQSIESSIGVSQDQVVTVFGSCDAADLLPAFGLD